MNTGDADGFDRTGGELGAGTTCGTPGGRDGVLRCGLGVRAGSGDAAMPRGVLWLRVGAISAMPDGVEAIGPDGDSTIAIGSSKGGGTDNGDGVAVSANAGGGTEGGTDSGTATAGAGVQAGGSVCTGAG